MVAPAARGTGAEATGCRVEYSISLTALSTSDSRNGRILACRTAAVMQASAGVLTNGRPIRTSMTSPVGNHVTRTRTRAIIPAKHETTDRDTTPSAALLSCAVGTAGPRWLVGASHSVARTGTADGCRLIGGVTATRSPRKPLDALRAPRMPASAVDGIGDNSTVWGSTVFSEDGPRASPVPSDGCATTVDVPATLERRGGDDDCVRIARAVATSTSVPMPATRRKRGERRSIGGATTSEPRSVGPAR